MSGYICGSCKTENVKLWMSAGKYDEPVLLCATCAAKHAHVCIEGITTEGTHNQLPGTPTFHIGQFEPAIPDNNGYFHFYSCVYIEAKPGFCEKFSQWKKLPNFPA
jgi:hypothetical protein